MSMDDLVWVQVFSPDVSLWERFNAAYLNASPKNYQRVRSSAQVLC
jgi:hypothetical protein